MAHMVILSETVSRVTYCPQKCHINPRMSWDVLEYLGLFTRPSPWHKDFQDLDAEVLMEGSQQLAAFLVH